MSILSINQMEATMAGRFWSTAEVAVLLDVSKQTVLNKFKKGELEGAEKLSSGRSTVIIPAGTVRRLRDDEIKKLRERLAELEATPV